jgi:hypothetical protein
VKDIGNWLRTASTGLHDGRGQRSGVERRRSNMRRRAMIVLGYLGIAGIIVGAYLLLINRNDPVWTFSKADQVSGVVVIVVGLLLVVISAFTVKKWFSR